MQKVNNCISEQFLHRNVTHVNGTPKLKNVIRGVNVHHALTPNCATVNVKLQQKVGFLFNIHRLQLFL